MNINTISIIMPVFNEEKTLKAILNKLEFINLLGLKKEIIIVDDGSTDSTRDILKNLESSSERKIFYHSENQGKGSAVQTGLSRAGGDIITIQDADLEYEPEELIRLVKPILDGKTKVVYGSRMLGAHNANNFYYYMGNKLVTFITNILYNTSLTDMETCYKVIRADVLHDIKIKSAGFDLEPEITAKILKRGNKIFEMPISYCGRSVSEGKKLNWKDGVKAIWILVKYRFVD